MKTPHIKTATDQPGRPVKSPRQYVEVEFTLNRCGVAHVYVCGDFNAWHPTSLHMIGKPDSGRWKRRLALTPGRHEYKFVVDGSWIHDPYADKNVPNSYGTLNSVLEVKLGGPKAISPPSAGTTQ